MSQQIMESVEKVTKNPPLSPEGEMVCSKPEMKK